MVELKNVSVTYSSGVDALNNVSLKINDGDFAFVVGSSGAGKSTMIKLLLKEIDATSGVVTVNGYNLNKLKRRKIPIQLHRSQLRSQAGAELRRLPLLKGGLKGRHGAVGLHVRTQVFCEPLLIS